ncbi:hypothetical protein QFZ96_005493 [Paraburkholderia youngii]
MVRRAIYAYQVFHCLRRGICRAAQTSARMIEPGLGEGAPAQSAPGAETKNRPVAGGSTSPREISNSLKFLLLRRHVQLRRRLILDRFVLMALQTILVAYHLSVELVDH